MKIAPGKEGRPPELDTMAEVFAVAGISMGSTSF